MYVPARRVLLEDVVLHGAGDLFGWAALLLRDELIQQQQHRGGRVDRHRGRHPVERNVHRGGSPCPPASRSPLPPCRPRRWTSGHPSRSRSGWEGRMPPTARSGPASAGTGSARSTLAAEPNPAYWRMVHRRPRYMSLWMPRVNGKAPGAGSSARRSSTEYTGLSGTPAVVVDVAHFPRTPSARRPCSWDARTRCACHGVPMRGSESISSSPASRALQRRARCRPRRRRRDGGPVRAWPRTSRPANPRAGPTSARPRRRRP